MKQMRQKPPIFCPITQLARVLQHNYNFPISYSTLRRYVHEGIITPDYVLKRRFLFHKDRVPEIVNTLKNKFHEKLSQIIQKKKSK